jgi:hypothetical protein
MLEVMAALVTWSSPYRSSGAFSGSSGALERDASPCSCCCGSSLRSSAIATDDVP